MTLRVMITFYATFFVRLCSSRGCAWEEPHSPRVGVEGLAHHICVGRHTDISLERI